MPFTDERIGLVGGEAYIVHPVAKALSANGSSVKLFGERPGATGSFPVQGFGNDPGLLDGLDQVLLLSRPPTAGVSEDDLTRENVLNAVWTAKIAAQAGVKRLIYLSSFSVYGRSSTIPVGPHSPAMPDNMHGRVTVAVESALAETASPVGLELVLVRKPMVYGAGCTGSFAQLASLVRTGLPLPLAQAKSMRSFCSVANLVSALQHVIASIAPPSVLLPADPADLNTAELIVAIGNSIGRRVILWSAPRFVVNVPLTIMGRSEVASSLFEPLPVDRTHWEDWLWQPIESSAEGIRGALAPPH